MKLKTEFNFILPRGDSRIADTGTKTSGVMRLMKVRDLLDAYRDVRVKETPSYFYVVLLCRVITRLGNLRMVNARTIENLYPEDFAYLVDLVNEINHKLLTVLPVECQDCGKKYAGEVRILGEL